MLSRHGKKSKGKKLMQRSDRTGFTGQMKRRKVDEIEAPFQGPDIQQKEEGAAVLW